MSTQTNPLASKAGESLLAEMGKRFVSSEALQTSLKDFSDENEKKFEAVKAFLAEKMDANLKAMIEAKQAPIISSRSAWKVTSKLTGKVHEMEYSLGRILHVLNERKRIGASPR